MNTTENRALVIVDMQNDFITGSLAVPGAETLIEKVNLLTRAFGRAALPIAATKDFHPKDTAHFSDEPNYVDTWPVHCVAGTWGADLHAGLEITKHRATATRFIKGTEPCESPADDNSYTGVLAHNPETGLDLPKWLENHAVKEVDVVGLAIGDGDKNKLCVDSTATDLHELGYKVNLVTDVTEAVLPENRAKCFKNLGEKGIRLVTMEQVLEELGDEN